MQNDKEQFKKEFKSRLIHFTVRIVRCCDGLKAKRILWSIIDQLIRSAGSIGANVVEAKASSSKREYIKFFEIALKSANETIYWLMVLKDVVDAAEKTEIEALYQESIELSKVLGASLLTLKNKR